ncbi:potassium-transporting ATPase subunit KdpA [Candidatus Proelusimicrobium volucris]|uniref:potassium-transporting ATPase subunit KdpA n=1 Tax=Candidatus Proelusimicrobium volucris TaxID=3416225 RepID=UPI003D11BAD7
MDTNQWVQVLFYTLLLIALSPFIGKYMARVFRGEETLLSPILGPLERLIYRIAGIAPQKEMGWKEYTLCLLAFNGLGLLVLFLMLICQGFLPLNPNHLPGLKWDLAFNTAVSFVTNTNWQAYSGESTLSYFSQMLGLGVQNFLSAATGLTVLVAFIRGLIRKKTNMLGNFWSDLVKSTLYILLPLSMVLAFWLTTEGVPQTFKKNIVVQTLEGQEQTIPLGPAASQIAIKQLGSNGGGFYGTNSSHPLENPTPTSNFLEMFALLMLPAGCVFLFGFMTGEKKHAVLLFTIMLLIWVGGLAISIWSENYNATQLGVESVMEGKETRFGMINSVLWSTATTSASNGAVNSMHSSLSPMAGGIALFNMMLGEIVFGGVGAGMYGMLVFILLTVFLSGLMVGRTPEYLGKKIEQKEVKMCVIAILAPAFCILFGSALGVFLESARNSILNPGPHGLTEVLYAFTSGAGNNGSAFAGLNVNTVFYNLGIGISMLIGRFAIIVPCLVMAGSLASKKTMATSQGTFPTDGLLFGGLLLGVILVVGVLTYFPALALGPVLEMLMLG